MNERIKMLNERYSGENEDVRLLSNAGQVEFITTTTYIEKYLSKGDKILEVGAGTGRYSLYYANKGYDVTAVELVKANLKVLKQNIKKGTNIKALQGDALDLSRFADNTFDVTLVLGPLYHLFTDADNKQAISEAVRVTKPGGIIAIAYLPSDSIMLDWALKKRHLIDGQDVDFDSKTFKMINYVGGNFSAFYISEFKKLMKNFNVKMLNNVATDGMSHHVKDELNALTPEEFDVWLRYHLSTCEREDLQGYSNHMLYICKKV